jgi:hypothetical protein
MRALHSFDDKKAFRHVGGTRTCCTNHPVHTLAHVPRKIAPRAESTMVLHHDKTLYCKATDDKLTGQYLDGPKN